jgi:phage shock protein A
VTERDALKCELTECDRQLQYLDQLIRNKDVDTQQLMHSYRKLIADHEKLELAFHNAQDDAKSGRMELVMREKRIEQVTTELDQTSQIANKLKVDVMALESQCSSKCLLN